VDEAAPLEPIEIKLGEKYKRPVVKKQKSRHEGNPNKKRNKAKGKVLEEARAATAAHVPTLVLVDGVRRRWKKAGE
jgi:hypothetical protein